MKLKLLFIVLTLSTLLGTPLTRAEDTVGEIPLELVDPGAVPAQTFYKARVVEITEDNSWDSSSAGSGLITPLREQTAKLEILNGDEKGKIIEVQRTDTSTSPNAWVTKDEIVIVAKTLLPDQISYDVIDKYRIPPLWVILALFIACAIFFGRWRGFTSLLGLAFTILVLLKFMIPQILSGSNPILITLVSAILIAVFSIYLAHGINKRITIAVLSTLLTLILAIGLAYVFVHLTKLFGLGTEEAVYLQAGYEGILNLQGLLLSGIIIGTLGVLDDITTSQVAAIDEIKKANPHQSPISLYKSGISVGREHISSLVNTLVLAYAGASLPLFILFVVNTAQPLWVTLNSEFVVEEIVRTLVGSIALILAVPISTILATQLLDKNLTPPFLKRLTKYLPKHLKV